MSFLAIMETVLLGPLKLLFEFLFQWTNQVVKNPGTSIVFLSLFVNLLVLPLYKRADKIQAEARDVEAKLKDGIEHIKKYFTGDERMMILQTYYRQNNYKPTDALKSSISLLLQIPFFITAYRFLSNLSVLEGATLGPIKDLSAPDGLLIIGGITVNCLPFIMALVNIISGVIYSKDFPMKTKVQLYGMALFFLVVLYNSPAGLVFYWTLNNVFSLVKTIFYKLKNPIKALVMASSCAGVVVLAVAGIIYRNAIFHEKDFWAFFALALQLPLIIKVIKAKVKWKISIPLKGMDAEPDKKLFFLSSAFLAVLVGLLIPATYIAASPQEYVDVTYVYNPLWYLVSSACMAVGTFLIWMRVFYGLASKRGKALFDKLAWILCGVMLVDYMFFGTNMGILSSSLKYEGGMSFPTIEKILNPIVVVLVVCMMYFIVVKWKRIATTVLLTAILAFGLMTGLHVVNINKSLKQIELQAALVMPEFNLSKTGKNVIVLMLDRAPGDYVPYLMKEKPELKEQFAGFTYYSNVISFGPYTNFGSPALLGGYEYTPVEFNKRKDESLKDKQNEANLVMPVLFAEHGYDVTVCDPVYTNYKWIPDLTIYDEYEGIDAYVAKGKFSETGQKQYAVEKNLRNFFCFSLMKTMPIAFQRTLYNGGAYNQAATTSTIRYSTHVMTGLTKSVGIDKDFMDSYSTLCNLTNITKITEDSQNTFLFMSNKTTHDPILLQEPDYTPAERVDNTEIYKGEQDRFTVNGRTLKMETKNHVLHYQANMASFIQLGKWFDYMRENGVYDNTKIIIVADHGRSLFHFDELKYQNSDERFKNLEWYYPLLMVKDFGSKTFTESDEFMTNGDTITLATKDVIKNPINPFTGNEINNNEKTAHDQFVIISEHWDTSKNNGKQYKPARWASVKDNMWNQDNWTFYEEEVVLEDYAFPEAE